MLFSPSMLIALVCFPASAYHLHSAKRRSPFADTFQILPWLLVIVAMLEP